jgi:hypothetical protein
MDNPGTLTRLGTRHKTKTNKTENTTWKTKKMSNMDTTKTPSAVPVSYKTHTMLLIFKYGSSIVSVTHIQVW